MANEVVVVPTPEARERAVAEFVPAVQVAAMRRAHGAEVDRWLATTVDAHDDAKVAHAYAVQSLLVAHPELASYLTLELYDDRGNVVGGALGDHPAVISLVADAARWRSRNDNPARPVEKGKPMTVDERTALERKLDLLIEDVDYFNSGSPRYARLRAEAAAVSAAMGGDDDLIGPGANSRGDRMIGPGTGNG